MNRKQKVYEHTTYRTMKSARQPKHKVDYNIFHAVVRLYNCMKVITVTQLKKKFRNNN